MPVFLICYELKKTWRNYDALYAALKSSGSYVRLFDAAWLVDTTMTSGEVLAVLRQRIDPGDSVVITELSRAAWKLPASHSEWITDKFSASPLPPADGGE